MSYRIRIPGINEMGTSEIDGIYVHAEVADSSHLIENQEELVFVGAAV